MRLLPAPLGRLLLASLAVTACGGGKDDGDNGIGPGNTTALGVVGHGLVRDRYTAELSVRGNYAYTSTWGLRGGVGVGNVINVWNVAGATPTLVTSLSVSDATTLGDIQVADDGKLLVVATERSGGSIVVYDLANPAAPAFLSRFTSANTTNGVHTCEVQRVDGRLYAFASIDPTQTEAARLTIVDLTTPATPVEVFSQAMGTPYVHDVFVRDGLLFTALWAGGVKIWDIGGGGKGGTPSAPVPLGSAETVDGSVHNIWWFHDPTNGSKRYAFVGEEGPATVLSSSTGDIHVVDVSDLTKPREVAFYHVAGAGTHNFSMNEAEGILYAAYYNGGVRAIDVRGDLASCTAAQKSPDGRCDLGKMGRELAAGPTGQGAVYMWGVQVEGSYVYASDMLSGLWKLSPATRP